MPEGLSACGSLLEIRQLMAEGLNACSSLLEIRQLNA
jgi:hypothetical protein